MTVAVGRKGDDGSGRGGGSGEGCVRVSGGSFGLWGGGEHTFICISGGHDIVFTDAFCKAVHWEPFMSSDS